MKVFSSLTMVTAITVATSLALPALLPLSLVVDSSVTSWPLVLAADAAESDNSDQISHMLNRLTYGPRPGDFEKVRSLGVQGFIQAQLNPSSIAESPKVIAQLERSASVRTVPSSQLLQQFQAAKKERKAAKNRNGGGKGAAKGARIAAGNGLSLIHI